MTEHWENLERDLKPKRLAMAVLEHLRLDREDHLLDLATEDRQQLYRHLVDLARTRLASLELDEEEGTQIGEHEVLLVEETLEEQGDIAEAAAVYALGHDCCRGEHGMARFERILHRFKLGNALLLLDERNPDNQEQCLRFALRTVELLEPLIRQDVPTEAAQELFAKLYAWCAWRYHDLGRFREAEQAFSDAAVQSDCLDDRIGHTTKVAELMARDGRKQQAFDLLLTIRDELPMVSDPDTRDYWAGIFYGLQWDLGGTFSGNSTLISPLVEEILRTTSQALSSDQAPIKLPAKSMIPLLTAELQEIDADDLSTRHRILTHLSMAHLYAGAHQKAEQMLREAKQLEDSLGDQRAALRRQLSLAQLYRFRRDQHEAAELIGRLLPEARRLLEPGEQLTLLGDYLEALAASGDRTEVFQLLAAEVVALLEAELRRQPGSAARRRVRFIHQRVIESAVAALLTRAERFGFDCEHGQQLIAAAWQVIMASRNPELAGMNREPSSNQDRLRRLEGQLHEALQATIVRGEGSRLEWTELLEQVAEHEMAAVTSPKDTSIELPAEPAEGTSLALFQLRDLHKDSALLVLTRHADQYDVRFMSKADQQPLLAWSNKMMGGQGPAPVKTEVVATSNRHMAAGAKDRRPEEVEPDTPAISRLLPPQLRLLSFRKPFGIRQRMSDDPESKRPMPLTPGPWFVFPDGHWCALPFEMLRDHNNASTAFGQNRAVHLCLRSGVLPAATQQIGLDRGWLGLGGVPASGRITALPGSKREVEELERFLRERGFPTQALLGPDAHAGNLRAQLREQQPAVLHIADHGVADQEHPEACTLILACCPESPEQELLPFRRIRELPLTDVDLVVLSACSSLIGRSDRSAGMEGLAWAFLEAGASQVIASRYPVDDEATVTLMLALYRYLLELPVAEALGRARDDCLRRSDPLHEREVAAWAVWS